MEFSRKKLSKDSIGSLRRVPIAMFEPNAILLTPLYVYLPKNQKFVAVKGPLQYLSTKEIDKFKGYENFYLPAFIDQIRPFQRAGESVRKILTLSQAASLETSRGSAVIRMALAQHELDDSILRVIGRLWGAGFCVEPFFLHFFSEEICEPLDERVIVSELERDVEAFELALLRSSLAVFLALHLGYCDVAALARLRNHVFESACGKNSNSSQESASRMLERMTEMARSAFPTADTREISKDNLSLLWNESGADRDLIQKLVGRFRRIEELKLISESTPKASLYGKTGIRDE